MSAMQISDSPLAEAGRQYFSAADAETWIGLLRPAFHLRALEPGEAPVGQLGGDPALPADAEWPVWDGHGPLCFVASVDCAQIPTQYLDIPLPESGTLHFFYFDGLGDSTVAYDDPDSVRNGTRVLYVPADATTAPRPRPTASIPSRASTSAASSSRQSPTTRTPSSSRHTATRTTRSPTATIPPPTPTAPASGTR